MQDHGSHEKGHGDEGAENLKQAAGAHAARHGSQRDEPLEHEAMDHALHGRDVDGEGRGEHDGHEGD